MHIIGFATALWHPRPRHATIRPPAKEASLRIVALEEHFTVPGIVAGIPRDAIARRGFPTDPDFRWAQTIKRTELADLGPTRYRGFAHLPMLAPEAAADELERAVKDLGFHGVLVNGATGGRFLDDPMFEPILARAEHLDVPIYLHPGIPTQAVRQDYFNNLPGNFSFTLALSAWGWHADTAIHTLRLALGGALDRHPGLKIIIGHLGEALPFMLDRIDETTSAQAQSLLSRSVRQTLTDQVWLTTSGFSLWSRSWRH